MCSTMGLEPASKINLPPNARRWAHRRCVFHSRRKNDSGLRGEEGDEDKEVESPSQIPEINSEKSCDLQKPEMIMKIEPKKI